MTHFKSIVLVVSFLSLLLFFGCDKKSTDSIFTGEFQNIVKENALMQAAFDDILKVAENILMNNSDAKLSALGAPLGCITSIDTVVTGASQKTYTVTFTSECTSYDGKERSGTMIIELSGNNYNVEGSSITVRLSNFYINSNLVQGKLVAVNKGTAGFLVKVSDDAGDGYATMDIVQKGGTTQWKSTLVKEVTSGNSDAIIINNYYSVKADASQPDIVSGVSTDGRAYTVRVYAPLVLEYSCFAVGLLRYPVSGEIEIETEIPGLLRYVNYGEGTCDNTVSMKHYTSTSNLTLY